MNGQSCCRVSLSRPLILLVTSVSWNFGILPHGTTLKMMSKMITGRGETDVILWFALLSTNTLLFQESLWISSLFRPLAIGVLHTVMMRLELRTPCFLQGNIAFLAIRFVWPKRLCFLLCYRTVMLSRGSKFEPYHTMIYVYVLDFALLCLVEFQQAK